MWIKRGLALLLLAAGIALLFFRAGEAAGVYLYSLPSPQEPPREQQAPRQAEEEAEETAPREKKPTEMEKRLKSLEKKMDDLAGAVLAYGLTAYLPKAALGDGQNGSATGLVRAQWGSPQHLKAPLTAGRHLYLEELEQGAPVAVINEQLAIALYRVGDPVGRKLTIGGHDFTVVGVVRKPRHGGDREEQQAEVPLRALIQYGVQTRFTAVNILPRPGSGAYAALSQGLNQWEAGGSFYSLPKEIYRARLPLRILLCVLGLMGMSLALRLSVRGIRQMMANSRRRLESHYAARLLPEFVGKTLLSILLVALNLGAIFLILQEMIAPVYVFPEWVPAILVEPREIIKTFWALRAQATPLVALRTPEVLRLQFLGGLMTLFCTAFFVLMLKPIGVLREKLK